MKKLSGWCRAHRGGLAALAGGGAALGVFAAARSSRTAMDWWLAHISMPVKRGISFAVDPLPFSACELGATVLCLGALALLVRAVRRRRLDAENRQDFISLLGRIVVILLCAWVLFTQVFLLTQAKGSSMFPAVKDGDLLICYRLQKNYAKNDVVVYTQGGKLRVGRILGREGDLVAVDDSGTLVVNGAVQSGEILYPTYAKDALEYPYTVPEGCFFVLGDYRTQSEDSRDFGPIPLEDVQAKVITLLRRRSL